jgi:hypothetical protein
MNIDPPYCGFGIAAKADCVKRKKVNNVKKNPIMSPIFSVLFPLIMTTSSLVWINLNFFLHRRANSISFPEV